MNRIKELECIDKLRALDRHDIEMAHAAADNILCNLLIELGYKDLIEEYHTIDKWYA